MLKPKQVVFEKGPAVVYVSVKTKGDPDIGTAFHVGDGYYATAKHVVEGNTIVAVGRNQTLPGAQTQVAVPGQSLAHESFRETTIEKVYKHPDEDVDVCLIKLPGTHFPTIQLDPACDDESEGDLLMREVVVLAYPKIPLSSSPQLVAFRAELSATMTAYHTRKRNLIISGMARGGFSGAPVLQTRYPVTALGIVSSSLKTGSQEVEQGFNCALTSRAIFETVDYHRLVIEAVQLTYKGFILPPSQT